MEPFIIVAVLREMVVYLDRLMLSTLVCLFICLDVKTRFVDFPLVCSVCSYLSCIDRHSLYPLLCFSMVLNLSLYLSYGTSISCCCMNVMFIVQVFLCGHTSPGNSCHCVVPVIIVLCIVSCSVTPSAYTF